MLWDTISEENCIIAMDCSSFQMPAHNNALLSTRGSSSRQLLNMNASLHEMAVDELSFYDDDQENFPTMQQQQHQRSFPASPQLMRLLSPECSPKRFQIIEKKTAAINDKFLQSVASQQKLQNFSNSLSTTSSNTKHVSNNNRSSNSTTPAKNFRIFHSLSSGSMESSMDDEYMELFEMESLEQQIGGETNLNFPSDLHSLISGKIKSSNTPVSSDLSSSNSMNASFPATAAGTLKTPEMRRPSVRRCLSMTENNLQQQQQQPKTPELLKQVQETAGYNINNNNNNNTTPFSSRLTAERGDNSVGSINFSSNCCFKRPDPPNSSTCSPIQNKRCRGSEKENLPEGCALLSASTIITTTTTAASTTVLTHGRPTLRKCMSLNDAEIMSALARLESKDGPELIGDFSKPFALPLLEGRHRDLKSISSDTVANLLKGEFDGDIANYCIVDCRYPYEYEGGHIRGAKNLYTHEQIIEEFLTQQKTEQQKAHADCAGSKRNIIIFHCEFSSERGPKLSRFLRNTDRVRNTSAYPALDYPEIYLLHNGYKEFYETHSELCDPIAYRPMLEPSYSEAYRHFRAKSKSWNGDGLGGATTTSSRLKKSRSRLML